MSSVNKVILVGNLGRDPDIREFRNGGQIVILSLATTFTSTDENGERQELTEWHRVAIFNKHLTKVAKEDLKKGDKVYVEGQLQTNKYTNQQGVMQSSTQIVLGFKGVLELIRNIGSNDSVERQNLHFKENESEEPD